MNLKRAMTVILAAALLGGCVSDSTYNKEVNTANTNHDTRLKIPQCQ